VPRTYEEEGAYEGKKMSEMGTIQKNKKKGAYKDQKTLKNIFAPQISKNA
jgi:hypothetical protein